MQAADSLLTRPLSHLQDYALLIADLDRSIHKLDSRLQTKELDSENLQAQVDQLHEEYELDRVRVPPPRPRHPCGTDGASRTLSYSFCATSSSSASTRTPRPCTLTMTGPSRCRCSRTKRSGVATPSRQRGQS